LCWPIALHKGDIESLVKAAKEGNSVAAGALRGDKFDIQTAARTGLISRKFSDPENINTLSNLVLQLPKDATENNSLFFGLETSLDSGVFKGTGDRIKSGRLYKLSWELFKAQSKGEDIRNLSKENEAKLKEFKELSGKDDMLDIRSTIDKAVVEMQQKQIDPNATFMAKPGENLRDYAKRENIQLKAPIEHSNKQVTAEQAGRILSSQETVNKQETRNDMFVKQLMKEGQISLASAYKMDGVADKFKAAVDTFSEKVDDMGKKPVNAANETGNSSSGLFSWFGGGNKEVIDTMIRSRKK
jgi:hypothetical protein